MTVETEYALYQTSPATSDGSGNASLTVGPSAAYTRWKLTRYSVTASLPVGGTVIFTLYRGTQAGGQVIDVTQQGQGDTSDANDVELYPGDYVTGVWSGTTPATLCTFTIQGSIFVRGRRSY